MLNAQTEKKQLFFLRYGIFLPTGARLFSCEALVLTKKTQQASGQSLSQALVVINKYTIGPTGEVKYVQTSYSCNKCIEITWR